MQPVYMNDINYFPKSACEEINLIKKKKVTEHKQAGDKNRVQGRYERDVDSNH